MNGIDDAAIDIAAQALWQAEYPPFDHRWEALPPQQQAYFKNRAQQTITAYQVAIKDHVTALVDDLIDASFEVGQWHELSDRPGYDDDGTQQVAAIKARDDARAALLQAITGTDE